ncbi:hypothetical protein [Clostridium cuniculi]|nr:hypothetical protein [Clostridium cuniculi]
MDNPKEFIEYLTEEELEDMLKEMKINYSKSNKSNEEYMQGEM